MELRGTYPPIPTPFKPDESLDTDHLKENLARWNEQPLAGYVIAGSTGESVSLSLDERLALVSAAREMIPVDRLVIVGVGMESTTHTIAAAKSMESTGADVVIVVTPSYYGPQLDGDALVAHYHRVADSSPLPVLLYNVPIFTGLDLPVTAVLELAGHENIIGIKESGGSVAKIDAMVHGTGDEFQVLVGSASLLLAALVVGANGCVPALGCIAAGRVQELIAAFEADDLRAARALQAMLVAPNQAVTAQFGVAGLKAAMEFQGFYGGPVREPLQPLGERERQTLKETLERAQLI